MDMGMVMDTDTAENVTATAENTMEEADIITEGASNTMGAASQIMEGVSQIMGQVVRASEVDLVS